MKKLLALFLFSFSLFAQNADLKLTPQQGRTTFPGGEVGDVMIALQNLGPDTARNVRLELRASAGATLERVYGENCTSSNNVAICNYGDVVGDFKAQFAGADYRMPLGAGTHSITATIVSDTNDPNTANNVATTHYTTTVPPAVYAFNWPESARLDPGQLATFETRIRPLQDIPAGTPVELRWSLATGTIESIDAPPSWSCTNDGHTARCSLAAPSGECCGAAKITVRAAGAGMIPLHAEAVAQVPGRDSAEGHDAILQVYRPIVVTTTADSGAGSLREEIAEANASCTPGPCKIRFDLGAPAEIVPVTPLPIVRTERIVIDGGEHVVIDGRLAHEGLEVHVGCDAVVRGLTLRNFDANQGLWLTYAGPCAPRQHDAVLIENNTLEANLRGLRLDGAPRPVVQNNVIRNNTYSGIWMWHGAVWLTGNTIENNGASGVFLGPQVVSATIVKNEIDGHPQMAIAVAHGARDVEIRQNSMRNNRGLAIDWGLDGATAPREDDANTHGNAPVVLSAVWDASRNATVVTVANHTQRLAQVGGLDLDFFADGEWLATAYSVPFDGTYVAEIPLDLRGKTITTTASRWIDFSELGNTSEISNGVKVM
jgi:hypothetical protein